jgi:hypothetical protein
MRTVLLIALTASCMALPVTAHAEPIYPGDIAGLKLWLDANDASTLTLVGDKVTAWANKGDAGVSGATAVSGREPRLVANAVNQASAIYFGGPASGNRQYLTGPTTFSLFGNQAGFTGQGTVFVSFVPAAVDNTFDYVMQIDRTGSHSTLMTLGVDMAAGGNTPLKGAGGVLFRKDASTFNSLTAGDSTSVMRQDDAHLAVYGFDNSGAGLLFGDLYRASTGSATPDWEYLRLGRTTAPLYYEGVTGGIVNIGRNGDDSRHLNGYIAEILVFDRALTAAETQGVSKYLSSRLLPDSRLGLVGHWKFNDGTGTTAAASVGKIGTLTGFPTDDSQWVAGPPRAVPAVGGALKFDGIDDRVSFGNDPNYNPTDALTIALWVKREDKTSFERFVSNSASGSSYAYEFGTGWTGYQDHWRFRLNSNEGLMLMVPMAGDAGEWIHLAATYDKNLASDNVKIYEDGKLVATADYSASLTGFGTLMTNRTGATDGFVNSSFADLRIYNTALSASEIRALIPEPGSAMLLLGAAVTLLLAPRRRRQTAGSTAR